MQLSSWGPSDDVSEVTSTNLLLGMLALSFAGMCVPVVCVCVCLSGVCVLAFISSTGIDGL